MGRMRIVSNLIDADGCTYNSNYRQRLLHFISKYRHIIEENGVKPSLTTAQKELLGCYKDNVLIPEQDGFSIQEEGYKQLLADFETQARLFDKSPLSPEEEKRKTDVRLGKYIYHFVEYLEKIFDEVLRLIFFYANKALVDEIIKQKLDGGDVRVMLGSNRQALPHDELNRRERGTTSIYKELNVLAEALGVKIDKFTLTDLYDGKGHGGRNFEKILAGIPTALTNAFDDSKVNIIYAACHRVATKNKKPDAEIIINMWDDHDEILKGLKKFYTDHSDLLPKGLILNLHKYDGKLRRTETVVGAGVIDKNYKKNTVLMAAMCGYDAEKNPDAINIAKSLAVTAFLEKRIVVADKKVKVKDLSLFKETKDSASQAIIPYPAVTH